MFLFDCFRKKVYLGFQGENKARQVKFDFTSWVDKYGENGTIRCYYCKPFSHTPIEINLEIDTDNNMAIWNITEQDTDTVGEGYCEFMYIVAEIKVKSEIFVTYVKNAIDISID